MEGPSRQRSFVAAAATTFIAALGAAALLTEFGRALVRSSLVGESLGRALFDYLRFFTILANWGVVVLMGVAAHRLWRGRTPPPAPAFRAVTVYILVAGLTYELLLRRLWSPQGLVFWLDLDFHDAQPALTLLFWLFFAPKAGLRWRDLPWLLAFPAAYFAFTLAVGALGAGYPYNFLDAQALGYTTVTLVGIAFLVAFGLLGAAATAVSRALTGGRSPAAWRRSSS